MYMYNWFTDSHLKLTENSVNKSALLQQQLKKTV